MKRKARSLPVGPVGVNAGARRERRFRLDYRPIDPAAPGAALPTGCGCSVTGVPAGGWAGQQSQAQGGQVSPGAHAGQAQAQPPEPLPASTGVPAIRCAHVPVGQGVVMHSMLSEVQPHASVVSAVQEVTSVCAAQGSAGGVVPQPHGAQAAPVGQAGQPQTAPGAEPPLPVLLTVPDAPPVPDEEVVVVVPLPHAQLHAGHASPAGHAGQLQVQVPGPPPVPVAPPLPVEPVPPPHPPPGWPQAQAQTGQTSPARQGGQSQVQVPPPPALPPSAACGGGQSHCTGGQLPFAGQANGCTQKQPFTADPRSKQKPPPSQL
jgi:hypothetical protein